MTKCSEILLYFFYPFLLLVAYLQSRAIIPPYYEPMTGSVMIPFGFVVIYLGVTYFVVNRKKIPVLSVYFFYTLITVISYLFNDRPIILYFQDVAYALSTMLIAFVAADKSIDKDDKFYKVLYISWLVCFIIGFYLYFMRPEWYTNAITEKHTASSWQNHELSEKQILEQFRFGSFTLDSYAISFLSMYLFPMSLCFLFNAKSIQKRLFRIATIVVFVAAILSMQRVAIICLIMDIFLLYLIGKKDIKKSMSYVILLIFVLLIIFGGYLVTSEGIGEKLSDAFSSDRIDDAVNGSRLSQIKEAFGEWSNPITGQGVGSLGGRARELGLSGVSDCCWVKIMCEQGIVGFILFLVLIFCTLKRALKNREYYYAEICAISNILLAMLVSDPIFYQRYILPFWFMIGRVWNKTYLERLKLNIKRN